MTIRARLRGLRLWHLKIALPIGLALVGLIFLFGVAMAFLVIVVSVAVSIGMGLLEDWLNRCSRRRSERYVAKIMEEHAKTTKEGEMKDKIRVSCWICQSDFNAKCPDCKTLLIKKDGQAFCSHCKKTVEEIRCPNGCGNVFDLKEWI